MGVHEHFGQNDVRLRQALDYDDSVAPTDGQALLWVPSSGGFAPRSVVLPSQRGPIGGVSASTLTTQTYSIDATGPNVRRWTLTGNPTLSVPTNGVDGQRVVLWLGASGATRTFTFASGYEVSPVVPTRSISIASGAWEKIEIECRNGTWRLVDPDQLLFSAADIGATPTGAAVPAGGPAAHLVASANQSVANSAWVLVAFASEQLDSANAHSTSSNNTRFVCPSGWDGTYLISGLVYFGNYSGGVRAAVFYKNGAQIPGSIVRTNAITDAGGLGLALPTLPVVLAAGDYLEVAGLHTNGSTQAAGFYASGSFASSLSVSFLRP